MMDMGYLREHREGNKEWTLESFLGRSDILWSFMINDDLQKAR